MQPRSALHVLLFAGLGLLGAACSDSPTAPEPFDVNDVVFAEELSVTVADLEESESGLFLYDVAVGQGPQPDGQSTIELHLTLWLEDGTLVADSRGGDPVEYMLSNPNLSFIPGFEEGLFGMNEGGTRIMVLPPELAYGQQGSGDAIPPNTGLVFQVELITVSVPQQ